MPEEPKLPKIYEQAASPIKSSFLETYVNQARPSIQSHLNLTYNTRRGQGPEIDTDALAA